MLSGAKLKLLEHFLSICLSFVAVGISAAPCCSDVLRQAALLGAAQVGGK